MLFFMKVCMKINFKISSGIKTLPVDLVFSSWVKIIKEAPIITRSENSKSSKGISFLFNSKVQIFSTKSVSVFFMFTCVHYPFPIFGWLCYRMW